MDPVYEVNGERCPSQPCPLRHVHDHQRRPERGPDGAAISKERVSLREHLAHSFHAGDKQAVFYALRSLPLKEALYMSHLVFMRLGQGKYATSGAATDYVRWLVDE
jgi:hypothetical protein